jgi:hypothetical protein
VSVTALVKFVQGSSVGTPGQALLGVDGTSVQVSNGASNAGVVVWTFTVISVPSGSSVPLGVAQTGSTPTWSFTPDIAGCFIIQLTVSVGGSPPSTSSDARAFGIYSALGAPYLIPSFTGDSNSLNFGGQLTGWDVYMEAWLNLLVVIAQGAQPTNSVLLTSSSQFTAGVYDVQPGGRYFLDLGSIGEDVTLDTTAIGYGQSFYAKLITSLGAGPYTCTINTITSGGAIESREFQGTLMAANTPVVLSVLGDSLTLESPDGTNLYLAA